MEFTSSLRGIGKDTENAQRKRKREDAGKTKHQSEAEVESKSSAVKDEKNRRLNSQVADGSKENMSCDTNEEKKKKKKRKKKQINDLRFEAEMEKLGVISKRRQRKKEYLKAKKQKKTKGSSDDQLDLPKRDEVKFGEVVQAPPKLVVPKALKKPMDASKERLRLQAIEAYRSRKGWTNRPGLNLPSVSISPDL